MTSDCDIESQLTDLTGVSLERLRDSGDESVQAGIRWLLRTVDERDYRFGGAERQRLD